ncbi:MAG: helix-turn-helix domain-containing protein [Clostridiaceae bacterium]|nr:helix-turn-helix domain-containing protein [Clostridiaceae bacterium]
MITLPFHNVLFHGDVEGQRQFFYPTNGITQTALAEKTYVSLHTIIAIKTGKRNPAFEVLYKIIRGASIPADLIFRPEDSPDTQEQEEFIREFIDASKQEQQAAVILAMSIWMKLRRNDN